MGRGQHAISYEDAIQLAKVAPDVLQVLLKNVPKGKPGPKPKNGELALSTAPIIDRKHNHYRATVLSVRLAQEYPKYYEGYLRGNYTSVTAAAATKKTLPRIQGKV
jgi:hypothetical protein